MVLKNINYKQYNVSDDEFKEVIPDLNTLRFVEKLGFYERLISLITTIGTSLNYTNCLFINPTHGGFIPLECASGFKHLFLYNCDTHASNISTNESLHNISNFYKINNLTHINESFCNRMILFCENGVFDKYTQLFIERHNPIIISKINKIYPDYKLYNLSNTEICVCIPFHNTESFIAEFHYYIQDDYMLNYDNLINICIMCKNGGQIFEEMLLQNLKYIDRWTILDTGSTDNTIEIINRVLVGKKRGNLFQEPFINFGESRNRCLELAGTQCKYNVMLDDTYVLNLYFREFLHYVRDDQFADSYSLYIRQHDIEYASNRVFKSAKNLKYMFSIHEVIQDYDNVNIIIPNEQAFIYDMPAPQMEERTLKRKDTDVEMLIAEINKNPMEPRCYYYLAQTYSFLQKYEDAYVYFLKRGNHTVDGFIQEKVDAFFEAARIANFHLKKPWDECEQLYKRAYELDNERPDSQYFMGVHYLETGDLRQCFFHLEKAFKAGYPIHRQYALKPSISFHFIPKFLAIVSLDLKQYATGLEATKLYLEKNKPGSDMYDKIVDLHKIFIGLCQYTSHLQPITPIIYPTKPLCIFVAPGGFKKWTGRDILTNGMGGSETFVVEIARYIAQNNNFQVFVFCECEQSDIFEGVTYVPLIQYFEFVSHYFIHTCFISRYSEFLPVAIEGEVENIYILVHDIVLTGNIIPQSPKIKGVFCLSEWHVNYFVERYPQLKAITTEFNYGVNMIEASELDGKTPYKFIYSSLANRGLYQLLCLWSEIHTIEPSATLHIYSDINSDYMRNNFQELMTQISGLIDSLKNKNVFYYGWVSKATLADSWKTADVWFYPCVFEETFCLTAFEAAASKTLAIATDLAGLKTTVGNRGVLLPMDCTNVITRIFEILNNPAEKKALIDANYSWIKSHSWKIQALKMETILLRNRMEYRVMYNWTNNIPDGSLQIFTQVIQYFNNTHPSRTLPYKILEIGSYTGTSLIKLLEMIPNSVGVGMDQWKNYIENGKIVPIEEKQIMRSFQSNIVNNGFENRVKVLQTESCEGLINMIEHKEKFDIIYVDGSHTLCDSYVDIVLAWKILNKDGIMGINDYLWNTNDVLNSPFESVTHFLNKYKSEMNVLSKGYRVFVEKIV